jgi:glycosyltransferase involved in cell wall biosynthesis
VSRIAILTATLNAEETLPNLVGSLREQLDHDFDWVVVDGGSTDRTNEILQDNGDIVVRYVSTPDFGIYDALNKAVRLSSADYYLVVGADDVLDVNAISNFKRAILQDDVDIVTASIRINGRVVKRRRGPVWYFGAFSFVSSHAVGTLIRRELHDKFGYYTNKYPIAADARFIKEACLGGAKVKEVDFVAGTFNQDGLSSTDIAGRITEHFRVQIEREWKPLQIFLLVFRLLRFYKSL